MADATTRPAADQAGLRAEERRERFVAERRRYEERFRALFREGRELGELRADLDDATAALLALSAVNWAYTWLRAGSETDELADRFTGPSARRLCAGYARRGEGSLARRQPVRLACHAGELAGVVAALAPHVEVAVKLTERRGHATELVAEACGPEPTPSSSSPATAASTRR